MTDGIKGVIRMMRRKAVLWSGGAFSLGGLLSWILLALSDKMSVFEIWAILTLIPVGCGCAALGYFLDGRRKIPLFALNGVVGAFLGLLIYSWLDELDLIRRSPTISSPS